jgi:hypothetical protein
MAEGQTGAIVNVILLAVILCVGLIIAYTFKDQLGLEDWNMAFLDPIASEIRKIFNVTGNARLGDIWAENSATFQVTDANGTVQRCTLGNSTNLAFLLVPSTWSSIILYNTEEVKITVGAASITLTADLAGDALQDQLNTLGLLEGETLTDTPPEKQVKIEITDSTFEDDQSTPGGYIRIFQSNTNSQQYATLGNCDFIDIARREGLEHEKCPPGMLCSIYPYPGYSDVGDSAVTDDKAGFYLGAYNYQWYNGDSDGHEIIGIERYIEGYEAALDDDGASGNEHYGNEYRMGQAGGNVIAPHQYNKDYSNRFLYTDGAPAFDTSGVMSQRYAWSGQTDETKMARRLYQSFDVKTEDTFASDDTNPFVCRYGSKKDAAGNEGAFDTTCGNYPLCEKGAGCTT